MPSFQAKSSPVAFDALAMADVFEDGSIEKALQSTLQMARSRAREVLQQRLPAHLQKLDQLLSESEKNSSPLWLGNLERGMFQAENVVLTGVNDGGQQETEPDSNGGTTTVRNLGHVMIKRNGIKGGEDQDEPDDTRSWLGGLDSNEICLDIMRILERETQTSMVLYMDLKRWIALEVPKVEDGNNFGVEVQQSVLDKISSSYRSCERLYGVPRTHYRARMEVGRNWNRFPNLKDHAPAIAASDREDFFHALQGIKDLRDGAAELLHTIKENWAKIYDPKNATAGVGASMAGMY